mmetsp:Transcript_12369/g.31269  ORF Transcript_12369/g.31269 Transcript_12369/m.31269 type:complete len:212 (-) Transcript_12369:842-1477(-)
MQSKQHETMEVAKKEKAATSHPSSCVREEGPATFESSTENLSITSNVVFAKSWGGNNAAPSWLTASITLSSGESLSSSVRRCVSRSLASAVGRCVGSPTESIDHSLPRSASGSTPSRRKFAGNSARMRRSAGLCFAPGCASRCCRTAPATQLTKTSLTVQPKASFTCCTLAKGIGAPVVATRRADRPGLPWHDGSLSGVGASAGSKGTRAP